MPSISDLVSTLQSTPAADRGAALMAWRADEGDLGGAAWDEPEALLTAAGLLAEGGLAEDAAHELADATRDRARQTVRGSDDELDYRIAAAFAQACRACGRTAEAHEALAAVARTDHRPLVEAQLDAAYEAWAAHAPYQADWVDADGAPRWDLPDPDGDAHSHLILTASAMTMNGMTQHSLMVDGAKELAGLQPADIEGLAARLGRDDLTGGKLQSPHADANIAVKAALLAGRRARVEAATAGFADAIVRAFAQGEVAPISQELLGSDATTVGWLKQAIVCLRNDGFLTVNESWREAVRRQLPEGYGLNADTGQNTPFGYEALVLQASDGQRSFLMLMSDAGQFGATPIG
jgi:hypothetical protein